MIKRKADEKPDRAPTTRIPLHETGKPAAAPLTEEELRRVAAGYIGETEKNLRP